VFMVLGLGFRVQGLESRAHGFRFRLWDLGCGVYNVGFRVSDFAPGPPA
jgi:hypothetical protein